MEHTSNASSYLTEQRDKDFVQHEDEYPVDSVLFKWSPWTLSEAWDEWVGSLHSTTSAPSREIQTSESDSSTTSIPSPAFNASPGTNKDRMSSFSLNQSRQDDPRFDWTIFTVIFVPVFVSVLLIIGLCTLAHLRYKDYCEEDLVSGNDIREGKERHRGGSTSRLSPHLYNNQWTVMGNGQKRDKKMGFCK